MQLNAMRNVYSILQFCLINPLFRIALMMMHDCSALPNTNVQCIKLWDKFLQCCGIKHKFLQFLQFAMQICAFFLHSLHSTLVKAHKNSLRFA